MSLTVNTASLLREGHFLKTRNDHRIRSLSVLWLSSPQHLFLWFVRVCLHGCKHVWLQKQKNEQTVLKVANRKLHLWSETRWRMLVADSVC